MNVTEIAPSTKSTQEQQAVETQAVQQVRRQYIQNEVAALQGVGSYGVGTKSLHNALRQNTGVDMSTETEGKSYVASGKEKTSNEDAADEQSSQWDSENVEMPLGNEGQDANWLDGLGVDGQRMDNKEYKMLLNKQLDERARRKKERARQSLRKSNTGVNGVRSSMMSWDDIEADADLRVGLNSTSGLQQNSARQTRKSGVDATLPTWRDIEEFSLQELDVDGEYQDAVSNMMTGGGTRGVQLVGGAIPSPSKPTMSKSIGRSSYNPSPNQTNRRLVGTNRL
jgi:hypothetical protein